MVACSLSGEPTLYPLLRDFLETCHKTGITTFLVSNGTTPKLLEQLDPLPTQLYISVVAPDKEMYKKLCSPLIPDGWEKLNQTLELLPSLNTRTVIRHTLINGWNIDDKFIKNYAKLDHKAQPAFIEPKAYVFVGYSRKRMTLANMPAHQQIKHFGTKLAAELGYQLTMEKPDSRVVLLTSNHQTAKIPQKT
jgi:tRNA wybutosine-synthesizing protein 1